MESGPKWLDVIIFEFFTRHKLENNLEANVGFFDRSEYNSDEFSEQFSLGVLSSSCDIELDENFNCVLIVPTTTSNRFTKRMHLK